jgi:hypothetical protein
MLSKSLIRNATVKTTYKRVKCRNLEQKKIIISCSTSQIVVTNSTRQHDRHMINFCSRRIFKYELSNNLSDRVWEAILFELWRYHSSIDYERERFRIISYRWSVNIWFVRRRNGRNLLFEVRSTCFKCQSA